MIINKEIIERSNELWLKHQHDIEKQFGKEWKITECFDFENGFYRCDKYDENNINKS